MRTLNKLTAVMYFSFWASMLMSSNVYAYVDPSTTAILVQIVAGVFISLGVAFAVFRQKITIFFKGLKVKMTEKKGK